MRSRASSYEQLRDYCESVPLIDCHDHTSECGPKYGDPIEVITGGYFSHDLWSASSDMAIDIILDNKRSLEERWTALEGAWKRTCYTGYAQVTRRVMKKFYDEEELTLDALYRMKDKLMDLSNEKKFEEILEEAHVVARIGDLWPDVKQMKEGTYHLTPRMHPVISLPAMHGFKDYPSMCSNISVLQRTITSLDEYIHACREVFEIQKAFGAVAFKDQSAYSRPIDYGNPTRAEAETVFNWMLADPRRSVSYPDGLRPLSDFLFHEFMRMARDMELPVQIHTGHMAGVRNEIAKTNAVGLTQVIELHRDVQFDLFHANWPYNDEVLFLCKNYPNVTIDFCWANIIDPVYCQRMFMQAVSSVPHGKIHGYGSDFGGHADRVWAHAQIARDNIAIALSELVEMDYLGLDDAKQIAHNWLFDNANTFFKLGL